LKEKFLDPQASIIFKRVKVELNLTQVDGYFNIRIEK